MRISNGLVKEVLKQGRAEIKKTVIEVAIKNKTEKWIAEHDETIDLSKMEIKIDGKNIVKEIKEQK